MENIKEKINIKSLPDPISLEGTRKILEQMNNCVCRIHNNNKKGIGFFIQIPFKK